ncbi:MAG: alpha/beta hydrolase [Phycisphaerae bacterium]|nr:alpha/beta hydrolase [Phycisphaerae bacterium]
MKKVIETVLIPPNTNPALERLPIACFEFHHPMIPATRFAWQDPPQQTNAQTFFIQAQQRRVAFRMLRATGTPSRRPVLMLLHGMGLHIASFYGIAGYVLRTHDLLLVDYNSYAADEGWPVGGVSLREMVADAMRVPAALQIPRFAVGGSSLGGGMSLMAALDFPQQVTAVTIFNPAYYPQELPIFYRILRVPILGELVVSAMKPEQLVCGIAAVGYDHPEAMHQELLRLYRQNMRPLANRLRLMDAIRALPTRPAEIQRFLAQARQLTQPVLVIWGQRDTLLASGTGEKLKRDLSNLVYYEFPQLSHLPHEEAPDAVGPLLEKFLIDIG